MHYTKVWDEQLCDYVEYKIDIGKRNENGDRSKSRCVAKSRLDRKSRIRMGAGARAYVVNAICERTSVEVTKEGGLARDRRLHQVLADVLLRLVGLLVLTFERGERVLERAHHLGRGLLRLAEQRHRERCSPAPGGCVSGAVDGQQSTVNSQQWPLTLTHTRQLRLPDCPTAAPHSPPPHPHVALQPTADARRDTPFPFRHSLPFRSIDCVYRFHTNLLF